MNFELLNENEYQKRFKELKLLQIIERDNDLKVNYSQSLLDLVGEDFDVFPPPKKSSKMRFGSCYTNAIKKMDQGYQYVEGIITQKNSGQKISHAWNIDPNGKHVDFTILETANYVYKGVIIPRHILCQVGFKNGGIWYCCLPYLNLVL
jgi:hypothetical protein